MNCVVSRGRLERIRRCAVALFCFVSLLPLDGSLAQSQIGQTATPPASLTRTADEVNKAGYSLKPFGLATNKWPVLTVDFSIERSDQTIFRNLTLADVEPKVDGKPVVTREGDLEQKEAEGAGVFVLLDGSGSMAVAGIDKLSAAKQGLKTLIDKLKANDRVGLIAFDEEPRVIITPTTDKARVKQEIESFKIRPEQSRFTRLYDAIDFALRETAANGIKNLLVISDGWETLLKLANFQPRISKV